jgi:hypothetical protein
MSEVYQKDESIHEPTTAHLHPLETLPQGSQADSAEGHHEHRDVSFNALAKWFIGLFVLIAATLVVVWGFVAVELTRDKAHDTVPSATFAARPELKVAWPTEPMVSPLQKVGEVPTLLPEPDAPMKVLRAEEDKTLSTYGWVRDAHGRRTGAVTIPVDRAIELTLQRGLPADNKARVQVDPPVSPVVRPGAPLE